MILHPLFSDHMVLQRGRPIRVFGMGVGKLEIEFLGRHYVQDCPGGDFCAELDAAEAGGPYEMTIRLGDETRVLHDVMIGEVFLAGGQSNMQMKLGEQIPMSEAPEDCPLFRYYTVLRPERGEPYGQEWVVADRKNCYGMSAIAWFLATRMVRTYGVAVGIVSCYQGAAILQSFIRRDLLLSAPEGQCCSRQRARSIVVYPNWNRDGFLYEYMVRQVAPYALRAVLWYQGESNSDYDEAKIFVGLMRLLRDCWREVFRDPTLPFFQVQIAPFRGGDESGPYIRAAQEAAAEELEGVYLVTTGDVGEEHGIHPHRKEEVAERLFRAVRCEIFGEAIRYLGPRMRDFCFGEGEATFCFSGTGGGLTTDGEIDSLYLLDATGRRVRAVCRVEGDTLRATAPELGRVTGAEFGCESFYTMHLFSGDGLPALQFRLPRETSVC